MGYSINGRRGRTFTPSIRYKKRDIYQLMYKDIDLSLLAQLIFKISISK